MIASLAMYDLPPVRGATDRYWQAIRARLGNGPVALTRDRDLWQIWQSPDLLLAQTCGYPYRARLHGHVTLVGTPDYGLPGCPPGHYNSVFIARADDPRVDPADFAGAMFAYNEALSQSGWAAPQTWARARGLVFGSAVASGAHAASVRMVTEGQADIAAIDALTWGLLSEHTPVTDGLKELARTDPTPALPYITTRTRDPAPILRAIAAAIGDLAEADRAALHLKGVVHTTAEDYLSVPTPPGPDAIST